MRELIGEKKTKDRIELKEVHQSDFDGDDGRDKAFDLILGVAKERMPVGYDVQLRMPNNRRVQARVRRIARPGMHNEMNDRRRDVIEPGLESCLVERPKAYVVMQKQLTLIGGGIAKDRHLKEMLLKVTGEIREEFVQRCAVQCLHDLLVEHELNEIAKVVGTSGRGMHDG